MNYTPPYTITNEMIELVSSISEKIGKITALQNWEAKPHLRKNNRITSIYSSLRIEANSLTLGQVRDGENVSEYVKKLLDVMDYGIPYTANAIMEKLQIKSKETFRKNYLNPAMQLQFVQMTIPEKPRSRKQRYIRK